MARHPKAPERSLHFVRFEVTSVQEVDPDRQVGDFRHFMDTLFPVVQPTILDAGFGYVDAEERFRSEWSELPLKRAFRLMEEQALGGPDGSADRPGWELRRLETLTSTLVQDCLYEALLQRTPDKISFIQFIRMSGSRARLFDPALADPSNLIVYSEFCHDDVSIPIHTRSDGRWVSGPVEEFPRPPIDLLFGYECGTRYLTIYVNWTPWAEPGTPEYDAFCQCLRGLFLPGWDLTDVSESFEPFLLSL